MARLAWDKTGERRYETGVDRGVLYRQNAGGLYDTGEAWNGLTTVTESPSGAEANPQYADNIKYLNLISAEEFGCTIEAFTYPDSFAECDGTAVPTAGVNLGQQARKLFGLSYRTKVGNDTQGVDFGYKIHLVYGALAAPSEKAYATMNDSPEAMTLSWEVTTTPVDAGSSYKPTAIITIDSTKVNAAKLKDLEDILYGTAALTPRLPLPAEVMALFAGTVTPVTPQAPTYTAGTHTITIPTVAGVIYSIDGAPVTGSVVLTTGQTVLVKATPEPGYKFTSGSDDDWSFSY